MNLLLDGLNEPQSQAVQHIDGPLLVLAGAGSGKTRVITRRVAYLITQGIDPYSILAITFTNKAAGEMRERVSQLNAPYGSTVCTFHALCAKILREFSEEARLAHNYTIYDRADQLKIVKAALERTNVSSGKFTPAGVHSHISNAKNDLRTPKAYADMATTRREIDIAEVYRHYENLLTENNALDFDDLLMRVAFLLRDNPQVRKQLSDYFRYILIDEYQDTNRAQYLIAHSIAYEHQNICATGDPDQSIYAWRGADIRNIMDFEKDYPSCTTIMLEENYRSSQPILTAASNLIAHNTQRKDKRLFTTKPGGEKIDVVTVDDEHAEARYVAKAIDEYRNSGGDYSDVAIFYRANSLSRVLEESLIRVGVPYRIARGVEFYNRKEIKDTLAYLKLIVNPTDNVSCERIINTPARGIGAATIKKLLSFADLNNMSLLDATAHAKQAGLSTGPVKKVSAFAKIMDKIRQSQSKPMRHLLTDIYEFSGLERLHNQKDEDSKQARANVDELITSAAEFDEENPDATAEEFIHQVSLVSDTDRIDGSQSSAVTLMTLHAAKGLEFPVVFMVGCEEGLLPFERGLPGQSEDPDKIEEERRLAFVGITRAMKKLTMLNTRSRMMRGQRLASTASRYLLEIGDTDIQRIDNTTTMSQIDRSGGFRRRSGFRKPSRAGGIKNYRPVTEPVPDSLFEEQSRAAFDDVETPIPPEYEYLKPGCMVRHPKFGIGKLVRMSRPWPDTIATILFQEFGQKKIALNIANIEMLDS